MNHFSRELSLEARYEYLKLCFEISNIAIWDLNIDKNELLWDVRMYELFDVDPDAGDQTYNMFIDRVDPSYLSEVHAAVEEAIETGAEYNIEYPLKSGKWIKAIGRKVQMDGENRFIGVAIDISSVKRQQERLQLSIETLQSEMNRQRQALSDQQSRMEGLIKEVVEIWDDGSETGRDMG